MPLQVYSRRGLEPELELLIDSKVSRTAASVPCQVHAHSMPSSTSASGTFSREKRSLAREKASSAPNLFRQCPLAPDSRTSTFPPESRNTPELSGCGALLHEGEESRAMASCQVDPAGHSDVVQPLRHEIRLAPVTTPCLVGKLQPILSTGRHRRHVRPRPILRGSPLQELRTRYSYVLNWTYPHVM
ncbi:hypothetical protein OH77DRAFT_116665 [Trametes cingulata]|nr:hypothetical protein OH77DRAFT_116665 [Trametes cingulata]